MQLANPRSPGCRTVFTSSGNLCAPVLAACHCRAWVLCFCFFFFPLFSSLFHKDTYSPLTVPWGFTQKAHPQHGKRKARAPGRGSSHKMWCVALCVPFVIPLHNELPWPPTSPGLPASSPLPLHVAAGRDGDAPRQAAESTAFVLRKGEIWAGWRLPCSCTAKSTLHPR